VRKSYGEKEAEYTQSILDNPDHSFHDLHICFNKGPNGSPTYDRAGFQLDYDAVVHWMNPSYVCKPNYAKEDTSYDQQIRDWKRMAKIFFEPGAAPTDREVLFRMSDYWRDRVSKDLGIPWHKVWVKDFEDWEKWGFPKAKRGEYQSPTQQGKDRMSKIHGGSALRK
jgi:hypothetical protein